MRLTVSCFCALLAMPALAAEAPVANADAKNQVEVTADQSLEWYQDKRLYVARGNAKAVRGDMTVTADILTAHERDRAAAAPAQNNNKKKPASGESRTGDIDRLTAEGRVRLATPKSTIEGDRAVYDADKKVSFVTGNNLSYTTADEKVTATESLEYWEDKKMAVARGKAVAVKGARHVEGDILTAEFRDTPGGKTELHTLTATGNVTVIAGKDVSKADKAVYDMGRNIAVLSGHVRITRADGTQLAGDTGEVDFAANQSRLMNKGSGRVRILLDAKKAEKK